jgi:hypothetical protein
LTDVAPFYAQYAGLVQKQGFFQADTYKKLKSGLEKDPVFLNEIGRYYKNPDSYFADFHTYTLALSSYTFRLAMGNQQPSQYLKKLDDAAAALEKRSAEKGTTDAERTDLKAKIADIRQLASRISEFQQSRSQVSSETETQIQNQLATLKKLYETAFSVK